MRWTRTISLTGPEATTASASAIAPHLRGGDNLLLSGPVGAGKSTFARGVIRFLMMNPDEEVPSPSFTLVQTYEAPGLTIWHVDLYRLNGPGAVLELGLDAAMDSALCLIEWPDRLGPLTPAEGLTCSFAPREGAVDLTFSGQPHWADRLGPVA